MMKTIANLVLIILGCATPLYFFNFYQSDVNMLENIQVKAHIIIFFSSLLLTYLNHKNYKQALKKRWWWMVFKIIGILGIAYAGFVLTVLYMFKDCCGF